MTFKQLRSAGTGTEAIPSSDSPCRNSGKARRRSASVSMASKTSGVVELAKLGNLGTWDKGIKFPLGILGFIGVFQCIYLIFLTDSYRG